MDLDFLDGVQFSEVLMRRETQQVGEFVQVKTIENQDGIAMINEQKDVTDWRYNKAENIS